VGEQSALAHSEVSGQAAQREALEALDRGDLHRAAEDRVARLVAAHAAPVALSGNIRSTRCASIQHLSSIHHRK
jgi:hypothetical protein